MGVDYIVVDVVVVGYCFGYGGGVEDVVVELGEW